MPLTHFLAFWSIYFLLFIRFTTLMVVLPFFNWRGTPALTKIGFAGLFAYLVYLANIKTPLTLPGHFFSYVLAVLAEVIFGLALGYLVQLIFAAVRMAGQYLDLQAGFAMSSVFDPMFAGQVTIYGQFYYLLTLAVFFVTNAHHHLFLALSRSVALVPPGGIVFHVNLIPPFIEFFAQMAQIALQLAAPILAILFFCDLALGLIAKTVPQLHVFLVGLPLKVGVALFSIYLILPYLVPVLENVFAQIQENLMILMRLF
ncbi:MAG: flagellar biosynthetic protein FliR [Firmicutes bacterium]|nr:flagellar biosynthetic protein FliR [Bacillota bacterium]